MVQVWLRRPYARILLGLATGAVVGIAVYEASLLKGPSLYGLTGATAGAVAGLVVHTYSRNARLTDVTITIPQLSELHFVVTKESQQIAWRLFVETVTRISVQSLDEDSGLIREALSSLYGLFQTTRDVLTHAQPSRSYDGAPTVEELAIAMLNLELRPFLSYWHPALAKWERANPGGDESSWPRNSECRSNLTLVQQRMREYAIGYARLAGVSDADILMRGAPSQ